MRKEKRNKGNTRGGTNQKSSHTRLNALQDSYLDSPNAASMKINNCNKKNHMLEQVKKDLEKLYDLKGFSEKLWELNPLFVLENYFPAYYNILTEEFRRELFDEWKANFNF